MANALPSLINHSMVPTSVSSPFYDITCDLQHGYLGLKQPKGNKTVKELGETTNVLLPTISAYHISMTNEIVHGGPVTYILCPWRTIGEIGVVRKLTTFRGGYFASHCPPGIAQPIGKDLGSFRASEAERRQSGDDRKIGSRIPTWVDSLTSSLYHPVGIDVIQSEGRTRQTPLSPSVGMCPITTQSSAPPTLLMDGVVSHERQSLLNRMSTKRTSKAKTNKKKEEATELSDGCVTSILQDRSDINCYYRDIMTYIREERKPLEDTERSLQTLIRLAGNVECLPALIDGLAPCIHTLVSVTAEPKQHASIENLLAALLNRIIMTCHEELQSPTSYNKTLVLRHLSRLLRVCLGLLGSAQHIHFTALSTINRMIDSCILTQVVHPWKYEDSAPAAAHSVQAENLKSESNHNISIINKKNAVTRTGSNSLCGAAAASSTEGSNPSHVHAHLERITHQGSPKNSRGSPRHRHSSWRSKPSGHQDSVRSLQSFVSSIQDDASSSICRDTSFVGQENLDGASCSPGLSAGAPTSPTNSADTSADYERTPLEILQTADPTQLLVTLQESITKHKQLMGARHKCTPSVRLKSCTHHCVQILSARVFAVMCQGNNVQHRVISEGHIQTLVDALDPNHDPHLLCLVLQALACMAQSPSLHAALTQADVPDTLMQLLLPSDEWYYTNHSTRYAHYVKYHAARILVYMGLFHRLGGRVHLFHMKSFEEKQESLVHTNPEDAFIDQMAMGKLLIRDQRGRLVGGSLEGIIAEIIKDAEKEVSDSSAMPPHRSSFSFHESHLRSMSSHWPLRQMSSSSGVSSWDGSVFHFNDLTHRPFPEYFFHALPLVVHPIIILRVLCHKMFGSMLRRKTAFSANNLTPPQVLETDSCPPRPPTPDHLPPNLLTPFPPEATTEVRRKKSLHVQIAAPLSDDEDEDDELVRLRRRRTKRAGSMDKHLLRLSSMKKRSGMSVAIKAIGDSLMQPLDLNISPPPQVTDLGDPDGRKRNIFKFPTLRKRSKSQGYIAALSEPFVHGLETSESSDNKSSAQSLDRSRDKDENEFKELAKELINLPIYEVDTHRMDQSSSPLLSRSSSFPEQLTQLEPLREQTLLVPSKYPPPPKREAEDSSPPVDTIASLAFSTIPKCIPPMAGPRRDSTSRGSVPFPCMLPGCQVEYTPSRTSSTSSRATDVSFISSHSRDPSSGPNSGNHLKPSNNNSPHLNLPVDTHSSEGIVFHFAAATPCESPISFTEQPSPPMFKEYTPDIEIEPLAISGSEGMKSACSKLSHISSTSSLSCGDPNKTIESPIALQPSLISPSHSRPMSLLTVSSTTGLPTAASAGLSRDSSHNSLVSSASSALSNDLRSPNFSLMVPSPGMEVPVQHIAVMRLIETWVQVCPLDLECDAMTRKEMNDFLHKMSSLGVEYKTWSTCVRGALMLERSSLVRSLVMCLVRQPQDGQHLAFQRLYNQRCTPGKAHEELDANTNEEETQENVDTIHVQYRKTHTLTQTIVYSIVPMSYYRQACGEATSIQFVYTAWKAPRVRAHNRSHDCMSEETAKIEKFCE
ncbi:hypothetical protein CAPTEDRAFT_195648 [Capitella teleta]|uniref:Uncharacterized protein n=1 Tax=Capitella teleta TaxID=283909 RepID=X1ZVB8_CAPTE|nr:hypothetical protein CAPTEDRAFT_195648 [Capitella teleta]|eukprot:ELT88363.1 hypothetical protein CAPTEDRAFT_195648 [Capitella teleta]